MFIVYKFIFFSDISQDYMKNHKEKAFIIFKNRWNLVTEIILGWRNCLVKKLLDFSGTKDEVKRMS